MLGAHTQVSIPGLMRIGKELMTKAANRGNFNQEEKQGLQASMEVFIEDVDKLADLINPRDDLIALQQDVRGTSKTIFTATEDGGKKRRQSGSSRSSGSSEDKEDVSYTSRDISSFANIIIVSSGKKSCNKMHVPKWPVFDDTYHNFPKFFDEIKTYLDNFCDECSKKSKVLLIQQHCFSKKTKEHIGHFKTVDEILARIFRMYNKPAHFIDSLLEPVKKMSHLPESDFHKIEEYYVGVIWIFSEFRELKQWRIFAHEQNLELLTNKLSGGEMSLWIQERAKCSEEDCPVEAYETFCQVHQTVAAAVGRRPRGPRKPRRCTTRESPKRRRSSPRRPAALLGSPPGGPQPSKRAAAPRCQRCQPPAASQQKEDRRKSAGSLWSAYRGRPGGRAPTTFVAPVT